MALAGPRELRLLESLDHNEPIQRFRLCDTLTGNPRVGAIDQCILQGGLKVGGFLCRQGVLYRCGAERLRPVRETPEALVSSKCP